MMFISQKRLLFFRELIHRNSSGELARFEKAMHKYPSIYRNDFLNQQSWAAHIWLVIKKTYSSNQYDTNLW